MNNVIDQPKGISLVRFPRIVADKSRRNPGKKKQEEKKQRKLDEKGKTSESEPQSGDDSAAV